MALPPSLRRAVRPLAASEPSSSLNRCFRRVRLVLQNLAWLNVVRSVSKVFNACCRGRSTALSLSPPTAGLTRRSSGRPTAGQVRLASQQPCRRCPPLTFNVRPPRRHMTHRHAPAKLPSAKDAAAKSASGCPSVGGQRTIGLSHRTLSRRSARPSESRMAQRSVQRLNGLQRVLSWSLAGAFTCISHRRPNPSVKRTVNGGPRSAAFGNAVPPSSAAYLKR
jgi:hypothetical protein